jgi:hypothetical protein
VCYMTELTRDGSTTLKDAQPGATSNSCQKKELQNEFDN